VLLREIALEGKGSSGKKMSCFKEGYSNVANDVPKYPDENKLSNEKCHNKKGGQLTAFFVVYRC
jgi:hypothetical protein